MGELADSRIPDEPVHEWFGLSYAQYLTIPRSIMEAMPHAWQVKMAALLTQLDSTYDWRPSEGQYWCRLKDVSGRFVEDPLQQYRRPNLEYIASLRKMIPESPSVAEITHWGRCTACGQVLDLIELGDISTLDFQAESQGISPGTADGPPLHFAEGTIACPVCGVRLWIQVAS